MVAALFESIDRKDTAGFLSFLKPECRLCFGNMPAVTGVGEIRPFIDGFFASIDSLAHRIDAVWDVADGTVCHGVVTYTRVDGSTLSVPFANILKGDGDGIGEYLIFADTSALYA